jgi:alginate O-acetyltransferase complex protein AlgI
MAQGLALAFGITLPNSFYYPYQALNVEDFFERFNMSMHKFIRRTVYAGLKEDKNGPFADCLNLLVVGALMGLWFGLTANRMVWGMYLAVFIIVERYPLRRIFAGIPKLFGRLYAFCVILSSFTVFGGESLTLSLRGLRFLFGGGGIALYNDKILYEIVSNWLVLLLGVFFAVSVTSVLLQFLRRARPRGGAIAQGILDLGLLGLLTALSIG